MVWQVLPGLGVQARSLDQMSVTRRPGLLPDRRNGASALAGLGENCTRFGAFLLSGPVVFLSSVIWL